jgi:hypothetical protein
VTALSAAMVEAVLVCEAEVAAAQTLGEETEEAIDAAE